MTPRARGLLLRSVRDFFSAAGYVEVDTPVRIPAPALEDHIDALPSGNVWLRTSPELHMKRLLTAGCERIYQLGACFRAGEHGHRHREEFTMLEWYRTGWDYRDILNETRELLCQTARATTGGAKIVYAGNHIDLAGEWQVLTVSDAFVAAAGWDPVQQYDADRFSLDLVQRVEPSLAPHVPTVLIDYPVEAAALARVGSGRVAERWELYIGGLELANAFSELTDPAEQRRRFQAVAKARSAAGQPVYPVDEAFLTALEQGMPDCAGVALGFDRLAMLLSNSADIDDVRLFD